MITAPEAAAGHITRETDRHPEFPVSLRSTGRLLRCRRGIKETLTVFFAAYAGLTLTCEDPSMAAGGRVSNRPAQPKQP